MTLPDREERPEGPGSDRQPPAGGSGKTPPEGERLRRSPALRVFSYYFTTLLLVSFGFQFLILATLGPEAIEQQARGLEDVVDVALLLLFQVLLLPAVLFVTSFFARVRDGRTVGELGLAWPRGTIASVIFGGTLAAFLLVLWKFAAKLVLVFEASPIPAEAALPWLPLHAGSLALLVVATIASAFFDEIIFRGYIYSTLRERFPWVHAAGLTNLLYLAFHAAGPAATAPALINIFLSGLLLAGLRERTGSLAAGVAFQAIWQLMLGSFYSLPLAGYLFPRFEDVELVGSEELSGGKYGPEGGWLITAVLVLGLALIVAWVERRRGEPAPAEARLEA